MMNGFGALCKCSHYESEHEEVNDKDYSGDYFYRLACLKCNCRDFEDSNVPD